MSISRCLSTVLLLFAWSACLIAQENVSKPFIKISGEVARPQNLYATDLVKMNRTNANLKDRDGKDHSYSGVAVQEILAQAGATLGKDLRGKNLTKFLLVKCADGYEVVFSLAELDSSFTDRRVIIADQLEGKALAPGKGPFRLIVPGEKKPARSSFQVTEFVVKFAKG